MPKQIELELLCDLTEEEVRLKSQAVGEAVVEQERLASLKRDAMKDYSDQLVEVKKRMLALSRQIRTRTEKRMVACQCEFHVPQIGYKRTIRLDTGEIVREEPMTPEEREARLFERAEEPAQPPLIEPPADAKSQAAGGAE